MRVRIWAMLVLLCGLPLHSEAVGPVVGPGCALAWSANTEADLAGYGIYWRTNTSVPYAFGHPQATVTAPITTATCAAIGTATFGQYYAVITAYDTSGNESPPSNEVPFVVGDATGPSAPRNLIIVP